MSEDQRKVVVVTGTRAEYGLLKSTMLAIREHENLVLQVVATGMHLSSRYGSTIEEIRSDGFDVTAMPHMLVDGSTGAAMAKSLGVGILAFVDTLQLLDPDVVLVLGDRDEPLAAGLASAHMNIPLAHVHGGDRANGVMIDESIRHALTKFSHLHFPATDRSANRIRRLGEEDWRIQVVGAPGLDDLITGNYAPPIELEQEYGIDPGETTIVILQHPLTSAPEQAAEQMRMTLEAVNGFDAQLVCVYPNSDAGGGEMIDVIESLKSELGLLTFKSLPRRHFLSLLDVADVLVGNSSSGIIEAPTLSLPVVDVGPRQEGRERADNTVSVEHDTVSIRMGIDRAMDDDFRSRVSDCSNPYARGGAGLAIANRLAMVDLDADLLEKELTF